MGAGGKLDGDFVRVGRMAMAKKVPGVHTERLVLDRARDVAAEHASPTPSLAIDLDRLFDAHRDRIFSLCRRMVGDPERAEELVQETLLTAYRKLPDFTADSRFSTWIYGIARNLCLNAVRKHGELLSDDGVIEVDSPEMGALGQLRKMEREALLREASAAVLTPLEQEAVYLRYVEGIPQAQITTMLNLDGSGARGLLQRCRRKLGRELRVRLETLGHGSTFFHNVD